MILLSFHQSSAILPDIKESANGSRFLLQPTKGIHHLFVRLLCFKAWLTTQVASPFVPVFVLIPLGEPSGIVIHLSLDSMIDVIFGVGALQYLSICLKVPALFGLWNVPAYISSLFFCCFWSRTLRLPTVHVELTLQFRIGIR